MLAGKSLGAAVAYRVFRDRPEVAAAALLTPVFRDAAGAEKHYPGLRHERRPLLLLTGNRDPLNARPVMEAHLRGGGANLSIIRVDGDHGLELTRKKDAASRAANAANIAAAADEVVTWLGRLMPG